jgi:DNA repair protein RadA/Sms
MIEDVVESSPNLRTSGKSAMTSKTPKPQRIGEVSGFKISRMSTFSNDVNRVLGGGIVPGSVLLLGGQPGIGKSTLVLQIAGELNTPVLYVSGEESEQQIKDRAQRLGISNEDLYLYASSSLEQLIQTADELKPGLIVVDSIQTTYTETLDRSPGSLSQVKECANILMRYAKSTGIPVLLIGHITKDGHLGGPKLLEHIVDVVMLFEGDRHYHFRLLRGQKNRYGSTEEIGIFEMKQDGLREVTNPSQLLLNQHQANLPGSAIAAVTEGQKSLLIEVQALVSTAVFGNPQRSPNGFDLRRMQMLLAVLERRCGLIFGQHDVFLNIAGGIRTNDPATDLAVVAAFMSAFEDRPVPKTYGFAGEVGLSGEVRPVRRVEGRILEAERMGMTHIFVPSIGLEGIDLSAYDIKCIGIDYITEMKSMLFS